MNASLLTWSPYAGAWIETVSDDRCLRRFSVAPYAGAWIETPAPCVSCRCRRSPPTRGRGLTLIQTIEEFEDLVH